MIKKYLKDNTILDKFESDLIKYIEKIDREYDKFSYDYISKTETNKILKHAKEVFSFNRHVNSLFFFAIHLDKEISPHNSVWGDLFGEPYCKALVESHPTKK